MGSLDELCNLMPGKLAGLGQMLQQLTAANIPALKAAVSALHAKNAAELKKARSGHQKLLNETDRVEMCRQRCAGQRPSIGESLAGRIAGRFLTQTTGSCQLDLKNAVVAANEAVSFWYTKEMPKVLSIVIDSIE
jgi:hypothetical protein